MHFIIYCVPRKLNLTDWMHSQQSTVQNNNSTLFSCYLITDEKETASAAKDGIMLRWAALICYDMAKLHKLIRFGAARQQPLVTVSQ